MSSITRQIVIPLALVILLHASVWAQSAADTNAIKPCSLLTEELVKKVSAANNQGISAGPKEIQLGGSGAACEWGDIILQIDPFTPSRFEELRKTAGNSWEPVPGVGDAAYFHNIQDMIAELFVRVGARTFGVVITIPVGKTAAEFKPNFIAVADAIVPKLR